MTVLGSLADRGVIARRRRVAKRMRVVVSALDADVFRRWGDGPDPPQPAGAAEAVPAREVPEAAEAPHARAVPEVPDAAPAEALPAREYTRA